MDWNSHAKLNETFIADEKTGSCRYEAATSYLKLVDLLKQLGQLNQSFLWASCIWGAIASGYFIYGWKQKALIPFLGSLAMTAASFFLPALTMSLVCLAVMFAVYWLLKQGY